MALADIQTEIKPQVASTEITLSAAAADAVRGLLQSRQMEGHALRVFVSSGGCSGYQYGMALEPNPRETDMIIEQHGVRVVVDEVSVGYLRGANIDYVNDVMASGFKIENPNASSACGCGHSFRTDGQDAPHHAHGEACGC
jgi:iron-sulfur cluster assembly accessory protein